MGRRSPQGAVLQLLCWCYSNMFFLFLFAALVNSSLPVLPLSPCYDCYSWFLFTSLTMFIADLFSLFRCLLSLLFGIFSPSICLSCKMCLIGKISVLASGLLNVFRTLGGRGFYTDLCLLLGSPYYTCWSEVKPVLLLGSITLNGTKITSIN